MSMTPQEARDVAQMRLTVVKNMQAERPADSGIDKNDLKRALELIRQDRSLGEAAKNKKAAEAVVPINLDDFMAKK